MELATKEEKFEKNVDENLENWSFGSDEVEKKIAYSISFRMIALFSIFNCFWIWWPYKKILQLWGSFGMRFKLI